MAKSLSEKIKTPERQIKNMAQKISEQIKDNQEIREKYYHLKRIEITKMSIKSSNHLKR